VFYWKRNISRSKWLEIPPLDCELGGYRWIIQNVGFIRRVSFGDGSANAASEQSGRHHFELCTHQAGQHRIAGSATARLTELAVQGRSQ
jgi:hypothetical protein